MWLFIYVKYSSLYKRIIRKGSFLNKRCVKGYLAYRSSMAMLACGVVWLKKIKNEGGNVKQSLDEI